jgi:hypothetical protein
MRRGIAGLEEAVTVKITSQAEFVTWWDTKGNTRPKGGKPSRQSDGLRRRNDLQLRRAAATKLQAGENGIPSRDILMRWRKLTRDLPKAIAAAAPSLPPPIFNARFYWVSEGDKPRPDHFNARRAVFCRFTEEGSK